MTFLTAWVVFPLLLALLSLGCGLLVQIVSGDRLPAPLVLPVGFALASLALQFAVLTDATAELGTPLVVMLALVGLGLSLPWTRPRALGWPAGAAAAVFAVFAAPVVLSGRATFAGYVKLDDTATYLAMLDRALEHGYNVAGLAPSTYEATLKTSLALGYPLGSLLPLGLGHTLLGTDTAWLWQPYLTFLAALLALGLYQLCAGLVASRPLRALVAFVGAQSALLYGYALWGGIKELAIAALVVAGASLVPLAARASGVRAVVPLAVVAAAVVGVLSLGGAAWLAPLLAAALALSFGAGGTRPTLRRAGAFVAAACVLAIPAFSAAREWLSHTGAFTGGSEFGNLSRKLDWLQVFGIWPNGDFRVPPGDLDVTHVLVTVVGLTAVLGLVLAWRRRAWELPVAAATIAFASVVYVGNGSPWVGAKTLASSSPVVLALAVAGAAALFERGRRVEGVVLAGVVAGGVLWSNALQYREVLLAPSARLDELRQIGDTFRGQGPTLMNEYESYGARHFLRDLDAEAASELRRRFVYLRTGAVADTGVTPDVDEIGLPDLLVYRTLVLRRSGVASRPPSAYVLVAAGRYYEVWQRPDAAGAILEHMSLGRRLHPAAVPDCADVQRIGRLAAANGGLVATVRRPPAVVIEPDGSVNAPDDFGAWGEDRRVLYPADELTLELAFPVPAAGAYGVWIGGSFRSKLEASVDGTKVGEARDELTWPSNFVEVGKIQLDAGDHTLRIHYDGPGLAPASAGIPGFGLGPFVIAEGTAERDVEYVRPERARSLCGQSLDWLEAVRR